MNNPDAIRQIQPPANVGKPSVPFVAIADSPHMEEPIQSSEQNQRTLAAGTIFGAVIGLVMGSETGHANKG